MTNFPRINACLNDLRDNPVSLDYDNVNMILNSLADDHTIEPIDDPNVEIDFWDWADVVGIVDEYCPADPFWAEVN
jgi:hypothetical protein